jgi:hypothetical protein
MVKFEPRMTQCWSNFIESRHMRASRTYLPRLTAIGFASVLSAASGLASAETVVIGMQATGAYLLDVDAAASALDGQRVAAVSSSGDTVMLPFAGFSAAVSLSDGPAHAHVSGSSLSKSNDLDVLNVAGFTELNEEMHRYAEGSSFVAFKRVVLDTVFSLHDQRPDDSAAVLTDASLSGVSPSGAWLKLTGVSVGAAPEPITYALMFGSMSIISSTARRRRNDALGWMASRRREDVAP